MVTQSSPVPLHRNILDKMFLFVQRYPFTVWGLALVMVLFLGGVAFKGLINPGPVEEEAAQPEMVQTQRTTVRENPETQKAMDLWLFGAIALGGALGSFLISQQLEQLDPKRNQPKRLKRQAPAKRPQPKPQPAAIVKAAKGRPAVPTTAQRQPVASAAVSARPEKVVPRPAARPAQVLAQPVVTVVPAEESHPLDWGEASLADMMDLRKRRPLSSLL